jgi:RNA recognition motif-containing protein
LVQLAVQKGKPLSPSRDMSRNRIYVGGLTEGINMRELEEVFSEVGHVVRTVDKKSFAFLVCLLPYSMYSACRVYGAEQLWVVYNGYGTSILFLPD